MKLVLKNNDLKPEIADFLVALSKKDKFTLLALAREITADRIRPEVFDVCTSLLECFAKKDFLPLQKATFNLVFDVIKQKLNLTKDFFSNEELFNLIRLTFNSEFDEKAVIAWINGLSLMTMGVDMRDVIDLIKFTHDRDFKDAIKLASSIIEKLARQ